MSKADSAKEADDPVDVKKPNDTAVDVQSDRSVAEALSSESQSQSQPFGKQRSDDSASSSLKLEENGMLGKLSIIDNKNPEQKNKTENPSALPNLDIDLIASIRGVDFMNKPLSAIFGNWDKHQKDAKDKPAGTDTKDKPVEVKPTETEKVTTKDEQTPTDNKLNLSKENKEEIGRRVWQNEGSGKVEMLTAWNKGESFPSMGIGHFTWQPEGKSSIYGDSFKEFVKKMEDQKNPNLPKWLNSDMGSPWQSKDAFERDFNSPKMKELRTFLTNTIPEQTDHLVSRLEGSLPKMLEAAQPDKRQQLSDNFNKVLKSGPEGVFALVDYVNFKGEGLKVQPSYNNTNWGLKQVLENMKDTGNPVKDFSQSAKKTLEDRVGNAPSAKQAQERQWMAGWTNRVNGYQKPFEAKAPEEKKPDPQPETKPEGEHKKPDPQPETKPEGEHKKPDPQPETKPEGEPKKPDPQPKTKPEGGFELSKSVELKAHPKKGQGYYQPLKESMKELLGRNLSERELKAVISGAKGLRDENDKPVNELKQTDMLLPKNAEEAKVFIENIGSSEYGRQGLNKGGIDKLKEEISAKFKMKADDKTEPPKDKTDPPKDKTDPPKDSTDPPKDKTDPPKDKTEPPKDKTEPQKDAPKPVEDPDHDHEHDGAKLQPGTLSENINIIRLADGADKHGAKSVSAAKAIIPQRGLKEPDGLPKDTPVAVVPGVKPGTMGVLTRTDADGKERHIAFIAGALSNGKGTIEDIALNAAAAKALGIEAGKGTRIDAIGLNTKPQSAESEQLKQEISQKIKDVASHRDVLERATEAKDGKVLTEKGYIPKPDDQIGYRRTERVEKELSKVKENLEKESITNREFSEKLKPGSPEAQGVIDKTLKDAQQEKSDLDKQRQQFQKIESTLRKGASASELPESALKDLPADLARDLRLARYNRNAYQQNLAAMSDFAYNPFGLHTAKLQENADKAKAYYKAQEARALDKADNYGNLIDDKKVLQDRIIADATHPKAQELLRHRYEMKSVAATIMATNPDLVANKNAKGALEGKRIAINAGHDPFHGSSSGGFGAYDWTKTAQNPKGMSEYDFNKQQSAILGALVEYAGGVPIHVNQDELYGTNRGAQNMSGLAASLKDTKADVIISNHMDDFPGMSPGTLTLVSSKSHKLGALINQGKGEIGGALMKPLREQSRGVQAYVKQENMILNELLTTSPGDRAKALNPYEVGKMQLGLLVGMDRFLNPRSNAQLSREKQRDQKSEGWDSFWNNSTNKPKQQFQSLSYPNRW